MADAQCPKCHGPDGKHSSDCPDRSTSAVATRSSAAIAPIEVPEEIVRNDPDWQKAVVLSTATLELMREEFVGKPGNIYLVMQMADQLNYNKFQALQSFAVINKKVTLPGVDIAALITGSPLCQYFTMENEGEGEDFCGVVKSKAHDRDDPFPEIRFSHADAKAAGLLGSSPSWKKYEPDMLIWKAVARSGRRDWARVTKGVDVFEDHVGTRPAPIDVTPPGRREPDFHPPAPVDDPARALLPSASSGQEGNAAEPDPPPPVADAEPPTGETFEQALEAKASREQAENPDAPTVEGEVVPNEEQPPPENPTEPPPETVPAVMAPQEWPDEKCPGCERTIDIIEDLGHRKDCEWAKAWKEQQA